jgi:protein-disulfide isomerase
MRSARRSAAALEKEASVKTLLSVTLVLCAALIAVPPMSAQSSAPHPISPLPPGPVQQSIEAYLRQLYALGPDVQVTVGVPKDTDIPGLLETSVDVKMDDNTQSVKFYVSKDGRYLLRGELSDLSKDPFLDTRSRMDTKDAPSLGDPNAPVTLVEYSDFECPVCRGLHDALRGLLRTYPQVRVIFKDYPIEQIHPWARTAALAGRCAYNQNPSAFWKIYDLIYDQQDLISAENAWTKMTDYAAQANLDTNAFKTCMGSPEAAAAIDASRANGDKLDVNSTPTVFVNGRRMVGADPHLLEQYIKYELAKQKSSPPAK